MAGAGPRLHVHDHRPPQPGAVHQDPQEGLQEDQQAAQQVRGHGQQQQMCQAQQPQEGERIQDQVQVAPCEVS